MPRLLVHIGSPKTGSTAIQYFLQQNADALRAQGVNFVRAGRRANAHNALLQARRAGDICTVLREVTDEIHAEPDALHILSSEMYFGAGFAADLAAALPDDIRAGTQILAYLRRQDKFLEAMYKQRVKTNRFQGDALEFADARRGNGGYTRILKPYADAFGPDSLIVRPFERAHFPQGNIVLDVARITGITGLGNLFVPGSLDNLTLSYEITRLLALMGRGTGINVKDVIRHLSHSRPPDAARSNDCFSKDERQQILAHYADINEELRATYTPDLKTFFDETDLADDALAPRPDADERLARTERAQEIIFAALAEMHQAETDRAAAGKTTPV